ncbi:potassium channel subfamily K member 13-like [Tigriopus californicus]|uniref:potassium channel subfamily K member 13-like n=1 Tax=Tigriopus californicus TaxID=6832 RepID=UPI0027DA4FC7|nr:potassium channel subfamily K member 13-like [Tigriopus californicus]
MTFNSFSDDHDENGDRLIGEGATATRMKILDEAKLNQQYHDDKRFHPSVPRVEMLRRRSTSSFDMVSSPRISVELPITKGLFGGSGGHSSSSSSKSEFRSIPPRLQRQSTLALLTVDEETSPRISVELPITKGLFGGSGGHSSSKSEFRSIPPRLQRQSTLALLTVDEETSRISSKRKLSDDIGAPPPPYSQVATDRNRLRPKGVRESFHGDLQSLDHQSSQPLDECCCWPWFLRNRPILRLFLVICFNGIVSMICAAIFVELERPEQLSRFAAKDDLQMEVERLHRNLTYMLQGINFPRERAIETLVKYSDALNEFTDIEDEIPWDMLAGAAFVNSVSSTTGYGDIVPVTLEGKLFTLVYALYGIPVFIWYVVKLGALFRVVVMRLIYQMADSVRFNCSSPGRNRMRQQLKNVFVTVSGPVELEPHSITEDLQDDKRFHPSIIGVILLVFMASVAAFISYMEDITYFNSVYACFITYSTIGFGDIDIYRISYRSNWFNLMIYGNCVHIAGYVILSAWVSSILDKCGIRRHR